MARVSSADLQRHFGRYRDVALREPVTITTHGRDSLVLLAAEEYHRLKQQDRRALHPDELGDNLVEALAEAEAPAEAAVHDEEWKPPKD